MRYKKVFPKTSLKTVDVLASEGAYGIGCYVSNGKLVPAISSVSLLKSLYEQPSASWYVGVLNKYVLFTRNRIYITTGELNSATGIYFAAKSPSLVETDSGSGKAAYVIGDTSYYFLGSSNSAKTFNGNVNSCVLKNGRIFGIDNTNPNKIKWSGEGGIDDWTESISGAGWTILQHGHGEILNLIVYKDKIVAVRERGLAFLTAYGNPENYKMGYLEYGLPKIYKNTVAVVGTNLTFCTEDGLYFYDGNKVEKCSFWLAEEMESPTFACSARGKYFLCGFSKTLKRKAILIFDPIPDKAYLMNVPANAISVGEDIFAYGDTREYKLAEGGGFAFTSGELDFSSRGVKVLKEIILDGAKNVEIEVSNGVISRIVGGVRGKFCPNMRGKSFKIKISGTEKIKGISAVAEVMDGV